MERKCAKCRLDCRREKDGSLWWYSTAADTYFRAPCKEALAKKGGE